VSFYAEKTEWPANTVCLRTCRQLAWYIPFCLLLFPGGCSPLLHPLYRDYKVHTTEEALSIRIEEALVESGWFIRTAEAPNVIATDHRRIRSWGLYTIMVRLDVAPVGQNYVRVYVHPYRHYVTGHRSKLLFLKATIRRAVLKDLEEALESRGLVAIGTGISRDREQMAR